MNALLDSARNLPGCPFIDPTSTFHGAPNPKLAGSGSARGPPPDLYPPMPPTG